MTASIKDRILELVDTWSQNQIEFLISLCDLNSYTFNKKGADRVSGLILEELEGIFPIHMTVAQKEVGHHHILRSGKKGNAIYLIGHTDTVFPPSFPFQTCRTEGDWLNGPGTADMKGGLAVFVYALKALHQTGFLKKLNITLILGSDEENGSSTSRSLYEKERENASVCLVAECAGENGEIVVSRNGKAGGRLECRGRGQHVATATRKKQSAILGIAHILIALESLNEFLPGIMVNVGRIEGGLGPGTVPADASFLFDLRWENEDHFGLLLEQIQKIVSESETAQSQSSFTILNHRPAMPHSKETERLLSCLKRTADSIGQDILTEHRRGTSDGNYFAAAGVPTLDGFGPVGLRDHTPDERILISSLKERTALLSLFLLDLAG